MRNARPLLLVVLYLTAFAGYSFNCIIVCRSFVLAELLRAKRASGAPWVRNFGKPMRARKFGSHVTVRASVRASVRTDSGGGGGGGGGESQDNYRLGYC